MSTLILDLDYTIFQTNTIDKKVFKPFFDHLITQIEPLYSDEKIEGIVNDMWKDSWDVVIERYQIPKTLFNRSIQLLENDSLDLKISTYSDYEIIKNYRKDKFLVTTGLTSLQNAKINALEIQNDFNKIIINDRLIETKTKVDIFKELLDEHDLVPENTFVIGDNPTSEIHAGNQLNLKTIQILRKGISKGDNADFYIYSFDELDGILTL
jgi:putative hydrolase of the HAD superfamily